MFFINKISLNVITSFLLFIVILFLNSCSNTYVDNIDRGEDFQYREGYPEIRLAATSFIDDSDDTFLSISAELVYASLIFKKNGNEFVTVGDFEITIQEDSEETASVKNVNYPITIKDEDRSIINSQETYLIDKSFNVSPGNYIVKIKYTDVSSTKSTIRTTKVIALDPNRPTSNSNLPNIQMLTKTVSNQASEYTPLTTYDLSTSVDSIKFVFQIVSKSNDSSVVIESKLYKFRSDTSHARFMNDRDYSTGSITYQGIDFSDKEVISSSRRVISTDGNILFEFTYPSLERGNYRFEVFSDSDKEKSFYKARDFGVKSEYYPTLKTARELAAPLIYLMSEKDHDKLMSISNELDLKKAIDRFWLSNINNKSMAKATISLFYERVEEANKQFSNFKEGWKTDRGYVYILFGQPWNSERNLNTIRWGYSHNSNDFEKNFFFQSAKIKNKFYPFDNFLLQRSSNYYQLQYQQIELWLSGLILVDNL